MKVAGIVAEYNPFHNGHKYHIEETKRLTGADYVIAIMSGDFVQRGAPAFMDKYDRAYCALKNGCDLVLELPYIYSSASAEFFASGAVQTLDKLGVCDFLSFGSESGSIDELTFASEIFLNEPPAYQSALQKHLKSGVSYPAARAMALSDYEMQCEDCQFSNDFWSNLQGANNILALEYLKSITKCKSKLIPVTIRRKNAPYHDNKLHASISSASAIRDYMQKSNNIEPIFSNVPKETFEKLKELSSSDTFPDFSSLTPYLHSALLRLNKASHIIDWNEELENRMQDIPWPTLSFLEIVDELKSRHLTQTRIQRALLHLILPIEKEKFMAQYQKNPVPYAKILGFKKDAGSLLKEIKKNSQIPVITKPASYRRAISEKDLWVWDTDINAAMLYQSIYFQATGISLPSPYRRSPIILE